MQNPILCLFFALFCTHAAAQPGDAPPNAQPGKCYAKCMMPDQYDYTIGDRIPVFIGTDTMGVALKTLYIGSKTKEKWVMNNKDDLGTPSSDWLMVGGTSPSDTLIAVVDTTQTEEYYWKTYWTKERTVIGGYTQWFEVLCGDKANAYFAKKLAQKLTEAGYPGDDNVDKITPELKARITRYQKRNALPVGSLDLKTLEKLQL